jgi:aldehyde:ferredoxin oxidoreductase
MNRRSFQVLELDLATGEGETVALDDAALRSYLGGSALAAYLLYDHLSEGLDPLSPQAPLLIMTGPLTGTTGPAVGRFVICAKSSATGLWGESNVGGHFGPELRRTGFDGLLLTGRAEKPTYLWLKEGVWELCDASHLWGACDTYETQAKIKEQLAEPSARIAAIGLAGENRVPFASVLCDHGRMAGRTGMGAVMGSKNLKAVAVRGSQPLPLADPETYGKLRRTANTDLKKDSVTQALRQLGTSSGGDYFDYLGEMPKRYFTRAHSEATERVSGSKMAETILTGVSTCHGCVIACGRVVSLDDDLERKGPEYETMVGFGPNLEIDDLHKVTRFGEMCDRYGMDTISASNVIGLAMLLSQEGLLTPQQLDVEPLHWGDADTVERLLHKMAERSGFGEKLAQGALALAKSCRAPELAAQVNGLEIAYHDPRGASGMALVYATSPRGACHNQSDYFMVDIGQTIEEIGVTMYPRLAGAEKAANVACHQDWRTVCNALVLCQFANVPPEMVLNLVSAATGYDYTLEELMDVGARAWNLKRTLNHRLGLTAEDDRLPGHLLEPLPDADDPDYVPPFEAMLEAYYQARGWDQESGKPLPETMKALGLGEKVDDIWL